MDAQFFTSQQYGDNYYPNQTPNVVYYDSTQQPYYNNSQTQQNYSPSASQKKNTSNPKEIFAVVRTDTFCVNSELSRAIGYNTENPEEPLSVYDHFSRFTASVISNGKATTANIPVRDIFDVLTRSDYAIQEQMKSIFEDTEQQDLSLAYTVKMASGNQIKGKTPAEVLLESPDNYNVLLKQYNWLEENLNKNPKYADANKKQMAAIAEACNLYQAGQLSANNIKKTKIIPIYKPGMRPLTRRTHPTKPNLSFVYEITINWLVGTNNPVEVKIQNYYAPVEKRKDNGLLNVKASQKEDVVINTMNLSASEWETLIYKIRMNMRQFEDLNAKACFDEASKIDKINRESRQTQ